MLVLSILNQITSQQNLLISGTVAPQWNDYNSGSIVKASGGTGGIFEPYNIPPKLISYNFWSENKRGTLRINSTARGVLEEIIFGGGTTGTPWAIDGFSSSLLELYDGEKHYVTFKAGTAGNNVLYWQTNNASDLLLKALSNINRQIKFKNRLSCDRCDFRKSEHCK